MVLGRGELALHEISLDQEVRTPPIDVAYIGFVEELPGANTQGATLEEARANLHEALEMVLQANRELIGETATGTDVIREPFKVSA